MSDYSDEDPYGDSDGEGGAPVSANPFGFGAGQQAASGSGLASIFASSDPPDGNTSLRYQAPRNAASSPAADPAEPVAARAPKAAILLSLRAREVYLYVAAENRQVPQGPCGIAFLGDADLGSYTLLLYKSQENHLARVLGRFRAH